MRSSTFSIVVNRKKWRVKFSRPEDYPKIVGLCDYDKRVIFVSPGAQQDTILRHELLHARFPDLEEEAILDIERILYEGEKKLRELGCP